MLIAEHYEAEKDIAYHSEKIYEISNRLGWHRNSNGMISALIDSAANQTTLASSKSVSDLFYDFEILVNSNVNKDLFSGIQRVKKLSERCKRQCQIVHFLYVYKFDTRNKILHLGVE